MDECSICLTNLILEDQKDLVCGHSFHRMCLEKWEKQNKNTCPMCRRPFPNKLMSKYVKMGELWKHYNYICSTTENGNPLRCETLLTFVSYMNSVINEIQNNM